MSIRFRPNRRLRFLLGSLSAGLLQSFLLALPGWSAERIFASFGPLERSISVDTLDTYARTGELTEELEVYSRYLSDEQLEQLRNGLLVSADLDVVTVSQFLYTPQGEALLQWLGEIIQTGGRQNGARAIRGAVIKAAATPDDFNVLNILRQFPTPGIRVDLQRLLVITQAALNEVSQTRQTTAQIREQAEQTATEFTGDPSLSNQFSLASEGPYRWQKQPFAPAPLPTDLYLPTGQNRPLVVISHGLGGNLATLAYLAEHLASHGFAVAVVEHPGSSASQLAALLDGAANEAVEPEELVNRPIAIQVLLDELERDPTLSARINLQNVGVMGQSLGAYTTLALAGAAVDLNRLDESCPPQITRLNLSLLLQCLLPTLPQPLPPLQDNRVQAAFAINPFNSAVFGPEGLANIAVPIMIVSGSADTVTPALTEQIRPFTWLQFPDRYLLVMEGGTHFSTIYDPDAGEDVVPLPPEVVGPTPRLAQYYTRVMSLVFFKTHLAGESAYRQYLDSSFVALMSQSSLPISLVHELTLSEEMIEYLHSSNGLE
ncbi:MAG: alpha/beta hydrolase [Leptolyngbya sp. SIO1D8]|nr:alpha/beta hydrolase [Leptolyngbya sp. SIO1D8]